MNITFIGITESFLHFHFRANYDTEISSYLY